MSLSVQLTSFSVTEPWVCQTIFCCPSEYLGHLILDGTDSNVSEMDIALIVCSPFALFGSPVAIKLAHDRDM